MNGKRLFKSIVIGSCLLGHFLSAKATNSDEKSVSDAADKLKEDLYAYREECKRFIGTLDMNHLETHVHTKKDSNQVILADTLLCHVVRRGHVSEVSFLLKNGADPNATGFDFLDENIVMRMINDDYCVCSYTPLCKAIRKGYRKITKLLLQNGADPNKENNSFTPLDRAAYFYCRKDKKIGLELIELLLENGADPNRGNQCHSSAIIFPLHIVSAYGDDPAVIFMLLNAGANIGEKRAGGNEPLHDAAEQGNDKQMKALIERGADVNALNEFQQTPLDLLIAYRNQLRRAASRWSHGRNSSMEFDIRWRYERSLELLREHGAEIGEGTDVESDGEEEAGEN
jgi:ankyrin repeat protein